MAYPAQGQFGNVPPPGYPPLANQAPRPIAPVFQVMLHIACKDLLKKDLLSASDPMVVVHMHDKASRHFVEVGRTEMIPNTQDPKFSKEVIVDYFFEEVQKVKFSVYDIDDPHGELHNADFLGSIETNLSQIVSTQAFSKPLGHSSGKNAGTITIVAEEVSASREHLQLSFRAEKLDKKDFLGKSDPFLEFSKKQPDGSFTLVHRTEYKKNTLNPTWMPFEISLQELAGGDYHRIIQVDCFDWDSDGGHDLIGSFTATPTDFMKAMEKEVSFACMNKKKHGKKKNYINSGVIYLNRCQVRQQYSFLDYIKNGCQINFTVAIDFTASNGDPNTPSSLHYINPYEPNEYTKALLAVGEVCQDYDSDKMFPALGFGAQIPPNYDVHFEFPLNFNFSNPYCQGLNGILEAYQSALRQVRFYGPTNFAPVIDHVAKFAIAAAQQNSKSYFILLILTDGEITDMEKTKLSIIRASRLPMSIIIVGVGNANFGSMEELDSDDKKLSIHGERAERDIVQFVPFRDFRQVNPSLLAKAVLAEVPKQLTDYYETRKIRP